MCGKISVVKWYNNRAVTLASTFLLDNPKDLVKRWSKKKSTFIDASRPEIVKFYNKSMGRVDKHNFLMSLYRTAIKSRKWTLHVIFHYLNHLSGCCCMWKAAFAPSYLGAAAEAVNMAIINSWLEYKRDASCLVIPLKNQMDLLDFTFDIAETVSFLKQKAASNKRGRPSGNSPVIPSPKKKLNPSIRPCKDVRFDGLNHMIERSSKQQKCKLEGCIYKTNFERNVKCFYVFMHKEIVLKRFHTK